MEIVNDLEEPQKSKSHFGLAISELKQTLLKLIWQSPDRIVISTNQDSYTTNRLPRQFSREQIAQEHNMTNPVKAQLHIHTKGDPVDRYTIRYTPYEAIDKAAQLWYQVMALTPHKEVKCWEEIRQYAFNRWIILICWVEAEVCGKHILIYNTDDEADTVQDFDDLQVFKDAHPECLIVAAHPYYLWYCTDLADNPCLNWLLSKYKHLFDAIEWSYFFKDNSFLNRIRRLNMDKPNLKALRFANQNNMPLIGSADVHILSLFNETFSIMDVDFNSDDLEYDRLDEYIADIFAKIKQKQALVVSSPLTYAQVLNFLVREVFMEMLRKSITKKPWK